jgi:hypothetical protein
MHLKTNKHIKFELVVAVILIEMCETEKERERERKNLDFTVLFKQDDLIMIMK